ncbi:MAG: YdcF family protein [Dyella sp.]
MLLYWRCYRLAGTLVVLAMCWVTLCATPVFAAWLQRGLEKSYPAQPLDAYPRVDAIVVLGGGKLPPLGSRWTADESDAQATRLGFGLQLLRSDKADSIFLVGADQALKMSQRLHQQGVPARVITIEARSENTHENAVNAAALLRTAGWQRILLVTSGIHMPRAVASFERQGLSVIPAPVPSTATTKPNNAWMPQLAALRMSTRCLHERVGLWVYRLCGWA